MGAGGHEKQEVVLNGISSLDEPSVEWGWHNHNMRVGLATGGFFIVFLLGMLIGPHEGNIENLWLIGVAATVAIGLALAARKRDPKAEAEKANRVYQVPDHHYSLSEPSTAS